jgi:hypothetical protein
MDVNKKRAYISPPEKFHARLAVNVGDPMHSGHHYLLGFRTIDNVFAKITKRINRLHVLEEECFPCFPLEIL